MSQNIHKFSKWYAYKAFVDGLERCNGLGKKIIKFKSNARMLDIGCGDGSLTLEFANLIKAREVYGVEYQDEFREKAERVGIKTYKIDLNGKWPLPNNFFDFILSSQCIEHMHNTRLYLEECYRCLASDGQVIILTENLASWINIGSLLFGWQPFSTTNINGWSLGNPLIWHKGEFKNKDTFEKYQATGVSGTVGHIRVLAYQGLKDLLEKVGFKNVKVYSRGYLPFWGLFSDILCKLDVKHGQFLIATGTK